ncbi:MAG: purine-nucleoside phosphorylase [Acidimicrobiales bacterium]|mgnify:FL=1|jgi:purine-nucleoside phosphorylase
MPTPHLSAADGAFAPTVLMPGDPKRAARIANKFLDNAELVTDVRAMTGFTGTWKGTPVSVMPSGMGMPSAAIYVTELVRDYGVTRLIRVGTAGVYQPDLALRQIIAAESAVTNSNLPAMIGATEPLTAAPALLQAARDTASATGVSLLTGQVFTSDVFYEPTNNAQERHTAAGVLCVEMECAALYAIAALENIEALAMFTMTDHLVTGQHLSSDERQQGVDEMIELALNTAVRAVQG